MQTNNIKTLKSLLLLSLVGFLILSTLLTSCSDDDEEGINEVTLLSYGPMPIARGAELRFIGEKLDEVNSIIIPPSLEISSSEFTEHTGKSIKLIVPQEAEEGYVKLIAGEVTVTTKTAIGYSEPIDINGSFTPQTIKPGEVLTINGDYLNLVGEVIFTDRVVVDSADFITKSRKQLTLTVPAEAQSGKIAVSNGAAEPIIIYSEDELSVIVPTLTKVEPNPVKPGTDITITGADLDLVTSISLGGSVEVTDFTEEGETSITFTVPMNTQDGKVTLNVASGVTVASSEDLVMVAPTVSVSPTTVKNGGTITVTGENLDLISEVVFADGAAGTIEAGGSATEIIVTVPDAAITGEVVFNTTSAKSVSGGNITIIDPVISSIAPTSAKPNVDIVITGTDLDLVDKVIFSGNVEGTIVSKTETVLTVTIPVGSVTGTITLVAINGNEVVSSETVEVLQNLPTFTSYSEAQATPGKILTINGTNLSLVKELVFPQNIAATAYGEKTDTKIEVYVPEDAVTGYGQIKMITYEGEEGFFPEIFIGGTDPITAETIMISNFNGDGATQSTWGGVVEFGTPSVYLDGTAAMLGKTGSGWQWTWAQNWDPNTSPPLANPENYVLKFDVCITKAAPGVSGGICLKGWDTAPYLGDDLFANETGGTWITMTFDVLTAGMVIDGTGDWGIWINGGDYDLSGVMIDNLRFDPK